MTRAQAVAYATGNASQDCQAGGSYCRASSARVTPIIDSRREIVLAGTGELDVLIAAAEGEWDFLYYVLGAFVVMMLGVLVGAGFVFRASRAALRTSEALTNRPIARVGEHKNGDWSWLLRDADGGIGTGYQTSARSRRSPPTTLTVRSTRTAPEFSRTPGTGRSNSPLFAQAAPGSRLPRSGFPHRRSRIV